MKRWLTVGLVTLGVVAQVRAQEPGVLAKFDGAIGVTPIANIVLPPNADGTFSRVSRNVVRGVTPAGPWVISDLKAVIGTDGTISVKGRGLLVASSDRIGQNLNQSVFATLICESAAPFVEHSTDAAGVALDSNGDFRIDGTLDPLPPADCASPLLLIRSASIRAWFAAAIQKSGSGNR
jgi:hypothetical protein